MPTDPDEDERLLAWMYCQPLIMAETDARRLRRKNVKALCLAIEQLESEAKEAAAKATRVAKLKRERDRVVRQMKGLIVLSESDEEDGDNCTSDDEDQYPSPTANGYSCIGDRKGKGPTRKC
ncbi:Phosphorylated carbohydrates phosphatase [Hordeum vulgare]|nr:Phosphorylated carbohydrates phosphatase [Hordeum vulgare]